MQNLSVSTPPPILLTTSEVAELLDAHPSSIKRWASEGNLPCLTTVGGHRRFTLDQVRAFSESTGIPFHFAALEEDLHAFVSALQLSAGELDQALVNMFYGWLMQGKSDRAEWALAHLHKTRYTIGGLFDRVLAPVLSRLGNEWERGRISVAEEHHVSQQVLEALYRLRPKAGSRRGQRPTALCAGAENSLHILPLQATRLVLEHQGWNVVFLGPAVPNEDLAEMIVKSGARFVAVSFADPLTGADVRRTLAALAGARGRQAFELAIGGKPTRGVDLPPALQNAKSFTTMAAFETWALEQTLRLSQKDPA